MVGTKQERNKLGAEEHRSEECMDWTWAEYVEQFEWCLTQSSECRVRCWVGVGVGVEVGVGKVGVGVGKDLVYVLGFLLAFLLAFLGIPIRMTLGFLVKQKGKGSSFVFFSVKTWCQVAPLIQGRRFDEKNEDLVLVKVENDEKEQNTVTLSDFFTVVRDVVAEHFGISDQIQPCNERSKTNKHLVNMRNIFLHKCRFKQLFDIKCYIV